MSIIQTAARHTYFDYTRTMQQISLFGVIVFFVIGRLTYGAPAPSLDQIVHQLTSSKEFSPFIVGEDKSKKHPLYQNLLDLSKTFGAEVSWVNSVSKSVLQLPFHPERIVVKAHDEFDGWFDEFTTPSQIFIHKEATMIILIHELRHALHLGNHELLNGNAFDRLLQKNKKTIDQFKIQVQSSPLHSSTKRMLIKSATRLIETCSEISAHHGDLKLSKVYLMPEAQTYALFIKDYKKEFMKSYTQLKKHPFSSTQEFVDELFDGLEHYMKFHNLQ